MADRTSAEIFAMVFDMLAKNPTEEHKAFAKKLWRKRLQYDFSDYQMGCDESLLKLDLAVKVGEEIEYAE